MKAWGLNPTKFELDDIMKEVDDSGDGEFDFPEFLDIMTRMMQVILCNVHYNTFWLHYSAICRQTYV